MSYIPHKLSQTSSLLGTLFEGYFVLSMAASMESSQKRTRSLTCYGLGDSINPVVSYDHIHDDLIEYLFSFLPVKDTAKLGVLSKRFQKSWMSSRKLCFGNQFAWRNMNDYMSIVSHVFQHHTGPKIDTLQLCFDPKGDAVSVQKWIKIAIEKGLEELDLYFYETQHILELSFELFDSESLKILKLNYCQIEFPPELNGLSLLHTLVLRRMAITTESLHALFRHCFLLETLELAYCRRIDHLEIFAQNKKCFKTLRVVDCLDVSQIEIDAPTLRSFHYSGYIPTFKIRDFTQLNDVMINITPSRSFTCPAILRNLAYHLTHVQVLTTSSVFLEAVSRRIVAGKMQEMQYRFQNLKEIQLFMEGATFCNIYDVAAFLQLCPSLEKIFIDLTEFTFEARNYFKFHQMEDFQKLHSPFGHLKVIKLTGYKFEIYELQLAKFFLQRAVNLEQLVLVAAKAARVKVRRATMRVYCHYLQHWKASQKSKISLYQCFGDGSYLDPFHKRILH